MLLLAFALTGCSTTSGAQYGGAFASDTGSAPADADTDTDSDTDADADGDTDTDTSGGDTAVPETDADGDGVSVEDGDCNDADASIYPGATDVQNNGIDEDCSGDDWVTEDPGQDEFRTLTIKIFSQDGDEIPGLMFNYCYGPEVEDPTDCDAWAEPGQVVNWESYIQWSSDVITTGMVRFNVNYYLDASDVQEDGSLEDDDSWFCYGQGDNTELTASYEIWFDGMYYDIESGVVGTVAYDTGCSAYLDIDMLVLDLEE